MENTSSFFYLFTSFFFRNFEKEKQEIITIHDGTCNVIKIKCVLKDKIATILSLISTYSQMLKIEAI